MEFEQSGRLAGDASSSKRRWRKVLAFGDESSDKTSWAAKGGVTCWDFHWHGAILGVTGYFDEMGDRQEFRGVEKSGKYF